MYVYDACNNLENKSNKKNHCDYLLVFTIQHNENKFTSREIKNAKHAMELHRKLRRPSYDQYINMIKNNFTHDCPITTTDIKHSLNIYGKDPATIKQKTKRSSPNYIKAPPLLELPDYIIKWHKNVTFCIDIFQVQQYLAILKS